MSVFIKKEEKEQNKNVENNADMLFYGNIIKSRILGANDTLWITFNTSFMVFC